jgi:integrase
MYKTDLVQTWLDSVAMGHSGSKNTEGLYRYSFDCFLKFIDSKVEDIERDFDTLPEKQFRRKYAQALNAWKSQLLRQEYASSSIGDYVKSVQSFFKYSNFPLDFIGSICRRVVYHNRDISKDEIVHVLNISAPRERAFYSMMSQSGIRPSTLCGLRISDLEPDLSQDKIPLLVKIREENTKGAYHAYISFLGEDAVNALKNYLNTRRDLKPDSYVFVNYGTEQPMKYNTFSSLFRKAVRILRDKKVMSYEQKKAHRPAQIKMYCLRKFFRKYAAQMGFENVDYLMGHAGPGVDGSYRPTDPEFYRKLYMEKAMPFLRLESNTPSETEKTIETQAAQIKVLQEELKAAKEGLTTNIMDILRSPEGQEMLRKAQSKKE